MMTNKPTAELIAWLDARMQHHQKVLDIVSENPDNVSLIEANTDIYVTFKHIKDRLAEQQKVIDELTTALRDTNNWLGEANYSNGLSMKHAIEGGLEITEEALQPKAEVLGIDEGSPDGDCTVKGYRDDNGNIVITDLIYTPKAEVENV